MIKFITLPTVELGDVNFLINEYIPMYIREHVTDRTKCILCYLGEKFTIELRMRVLIKILEKSNGEIGSN